MIDITCQQCHRLHRSIRLLPLRCRCGYTTTAGDAVSIAPATERPERRRRTPTTIPDPPCIHRGEVIGRHDCGCAGDASIYACAVYGRCMMRKLKPAMPVDRFCGVCDDRQEPGDSPAK